MNQSTFADCQFGRMFVQNIGRGSSNLIMLHGVTRRWQTFMPILPALEPFWKIHGVDLRGHGRSDRATAYRVANYVEDIVEWIEGSFTRPVRIYGHSLGAMVAASVAAQIPNRVAGVILEDPPLDTMGSRISESILLSHFQTVREFAGANGDVQTLASELADRMLYDPVTDTHVRMGDVRDKTNLRFTIQCLRSLDSAVLDPIVKAEWLNGYDVDDTFSQLSCPGLLLQADVRAGGMLTDADATKAESLAADLTLVKFQDCGHSIHWANTQPLLNHVHAFLATHESEWNDSPT